MVFTMRNFYICIPWTLFLLSLGFLWFQYEYIRGLNEQNRQKRQLSLENGEESTILLPIFAQISKKHIRKVCMEHFHENSMKYLRETEKSRIAGKELKRKCSPETNFGDLQMMGSRKNREGCAYLDGPFWHVCEMSHGYTILSFKGNRQLNTSTTKAVQFLPYPFDGTDNMVYNKTMWYSEHNRVVAYNFKDESSLILNLRTEMEPLYANSTSRIDIQAEEHGIWLLYRRPDERILTVSRVNARNMRIVSNWTLPSIDTSTMCNSFIRCAVMYSVNCNGLIRPVYDFYSHTYIQGREFVWNGLEQPIGNVQYDPNSKAIAIFANGKIFKVSAATK